MNTAYPPLPLRIHRDPQQGPLPVAPRGDELHAGLEAVEFEMSQLRQELGEAQERLDFAERMLAHVPEARDGKSG